MPIERSDSPSVIVLGGPNGAGKTTASRSILAEMLRVHTFVNADVIAAGLSAFDVEGAALEAGRIMLARLQDLASARQDFAFEATLAGRSQARWLAELRHAGYHVHIVFFWLDSADLAVSRVAQRVSQGGHEIPEKTIRRRHKRITSNFFALYRPIADQWRVYDNSEGGDRRMVAEGLAGHE